MPSTKQTALQAVRYSAEQCGVAIGLYLLLLVDSKISMALAGLQLSCNRSLKVHSSSLPMLIISLAVAVQALQLGQHKQKAAALCAVSSARTRQCWVAA